MKDIEASQEDVEQLHEKLTSEAESSGYHLHPDVEFTKGLLRGILINERRYGYGACPCRLASGDKSEDLDIICPCDYRDQDLNEYAQCYCALYVSAEVVKGEKTAGAIPERRTAPEERMKEEPHSPLPQGADVSVWRCRVCGYLCARESPPAICPICKAKKERFARFA